jgi:hypothetical protein
MQVGQGPNWGCSAKGKKTITNYEVPHYVILSISYYILSFMYRYFPQPLPRNYCKSVFFLHSDRRNIFFFLFDANLERGFRLLS